MNPSGSLKAHVSAFLAVVVVVAALTLAGCGNQGAETGLTQRSKSGLHHTLAQRYKTLVADGNLRLQELSKQLNQSNGNLSAIRLGFRKVSVTYRDVANSVQVLPFPPAMHHDVAAMVSALKKLASDAAQGTDSVTSDEFNLVFSNLASDQKTEGSANATVNHDLGISSIS